jgi:hypothetical protein
MSFVAKPYRLLTSVVMVLVLLAGGAVLGMRMAEITVRDVLEQVGIVSSERRSSSQIIAGDVRALARLNTVRYTMQQVFPYDFVPDQATYREITEKLSASTATAAELLNEEELRAWRAYNVALEAGLDPRPDAGEFVVISTTLHLGYRLDESDELVRVLEEATDPEGGSGAALRRVAEISLPEASILEILVKDVRPEQYPFPDVALSPEEWRRVAGFVREHATVQADLTELRRRARRNTERLLEGVLARAGFDEVRFENPGAEPGADAEADPDAAPRARNEPGD